MKIVVNRCFGGFGVSREATIRLIELGSPHVKARPDERPGQYMDKLWDEYQAPEHRTEIRDGYYRCKGMVEYVYKDGLMYLHDDNGKDARTDPALIQVIEEMGDATNSRFAELEIVEIPDGIEWEIDEYDGNERIDEVHRPW